MSKADKIKSIIKKDPKPGFGSDPSDQWSTRYNLGETALLDRYLKSRGINPEFASKDLKVAHSKTNAFKAWMSSHVNDPVREETLTTEPSPTRKREAQLKSSAHKHKEIHTTSGIKEDTFQDTQAATQMPFDTGNNPAEEPEMPARSTKIIKDLYKKKRGIKEDLYDHEKEDKSVSSYGKKPKMSKVDNAVATGAGKPQAAAVLSGGTTMTGQKRDTIEIDPALRVRPGQTGMEKPQKDKY